MKIELTENKVRIEYSKREWNKLEKYYQMLRLQRYTTNNLFGKGINAEVYRYVPESKMLINDLNSISYSNNYYILEVIDDLNKPLIRTDGSRFFFNVAILRVIPRLDGDRYVVEYNIDSDEEEIFIPIPLIAEIKKFFKDLIKDLLKKIENVRYHVKITVEITPAE